MRRQVPPLASLGHPPLSLPSSAVDCRYRTLGERWPVRSRPDVPSVRVRDERGGVLRDLGVRDCDSGRKSQRRQAGRGAFGSGTCVKTRGRGVAWKTPGVGKDGSFPRWFEEPPTALNAQLVVHSE